jgi:hypothetical protein
MNPFLSRIDRGEIQSPAELRQLYTAEVKRLHPDLNADAAPGVDFDRLRAFYDEALGYLARRAGHRSSAGPGPALHDRQTFLEEFRNLVARGFPVNAQAAAKNKAYAASFRAVSAYLAAWSDDPDFFPRANRECRLLKRLSPPDHWYAMQIVWSVGAQPHGGTAAQERVSRRYLDRIRPCLEAEKFHTFLGLVTYLVGE